MERFSNTLQGNRFILPKGPNYDLQTSISSFTFRQTVFVNILQFEENGE